MALDRGVVACATLTASAVIGGLLWYKKKAPEPGKEFQEANSDDEGTSSPDMADEADQDHSSSSLCKPTVGQDATAYGEEDSVTVDSLESQLSQTDIFRGQSLPQQPSSGGSWADQVGEEVSEGVASGDSAVADSREEDTRERELSVGEKEEANQRVVSVQTEDLVASVTGELASPVSGAGSESFSEANSEASSNDSGKGGSLPSGCLPAPEEATIQADQPIYYQFEFPTKYCGMLIGRLGRNIKQIREASGAKLTVKDAVGDPKYQLLMIEGLQSEVEEALTLIARRFPDVDVNRAVQQQPQPAESYMPVLSRLAIPEGEPVEVNVSSIVAVNHVFLQQPAEGTFGGLAALDDQMAFTYSQPDLAPPLPRPIEVGLVCVAPVLEGWYRAEVVATPADGGEDQVETRFVDYGGYCSLDPAYLRQIHLDFTALPFQATECYLANIAPLPEEECFSEEARQMLEEMTQNGGCVTARVVDYALDGCPMVELNHHAPDQQVRFLNYELAEAGVVSWTEEESEQFPQ